MRGVRLFGVLAAILCAIEVAAQEHYVSDERIEQLANAQQWAHLLHYRHHPFSFRYISQNDSDNFFLATTGKTSLRDELLANIAAFSKKNMADNTSAQCRFPARYHWLKQQLPEWPVQDQPCSEFTQWRDTLDAHKLTLIFPASHINSPSSMYGHTLVRLDRADEKRSKLLAYSVNFAANADPDDNELVFSYKGLTGGYPGVVSVMPYYMKTNEYQHMEYRDTWEYALNFTKEEVDQFVRHIWETRDTYFDYYFFDENCSYRLLALFDASSERADLTDDFVFTAMPVDTIRALKNSGLLGEASYRPSAAADMEHKSDSSSKEVLRVAKQLIDAEDIDIEQALTHLSERDQARALELAHAYARYLAIKKRQSQPVLRQRTLDVLSARAKRAYSAEFGEVPVPKYRDDEGHLSTRITLSMGALQEGDERSFIDVQWRNAYHDLMDLPQGFVPGSQIEMGRFQLRAWQSGEVRLQHFSLIDIQSLSARTYFQSPISWSVNTGLTRFLGKESELHGYLNVAFGHAYDTSLGRFYGLGEVQLRVDNQFDEDYQLSVGPKAGWLWQGRLVQAQLEANWQPLTLGDETERTSVMGQLGVRLADQLQLRARAERQLFSAVQSHAEVEYSLGVNWYF